MRPEIRAIRGCLLGTAVGDSIGLPLEGLSPGRAERLFGRRDRHNFLFGHGMISDDTEHAVMVAQALVESGGDPDLFSRSFARRLKRWFLLVPAGVGFATLRACLKLCIGCSPTKSGVFSAGNGPAMRSPIIGVACGSDMEKMKTLVRRSTIVTHSDEKAYIAAFAAALAAKASSCGGVSGAEYIDELGSALSGRDADEFLDLARAAVSSAAEGETTVDFARSVNLEKGITGYAYHTVPAVIHAWMRNQNDFRQAIIDILECGGDADTTAAILGGIVGAGVGREGIPADWLEGLWEWPMTVGWMEKLAEQLHGCLPDSPGKPISVSWPFATVRNFGFTAIVLAHGIRRLFPPYHSAKK